MQESSRDRLLDDAQGGGVPEHHPATAAVEQDLVCTEAVVINQSGRCSADPSIHQRFCLQHTESHLDSFDAFQILYHVVCDPHSAPPDQAVPKSIYPIIEE